MRFPKWSQRASGDGMVFLGLTMTLEQAAQRTGCPPESEVWVSGFIESSLT